MSLNQKSLLLLTLLWTLSLLLVPILLVQGWYTRRTALRLPDGERPCEGSTGDGAGSLVLGLGDSVIAGTGLKQMRSSVTAQVAAQLAATGDAARWIARGVNGARLQDLLDDIDANPPVQADIILVSIGVNNVTSLTGLLKWQLGLTDLISRLKSRCRGTIVLLGVPPMESFTALPQPLRWVLGVRAAMLDKSLQQIGSLLPGVCWLDVGMKFDAEHLAQDGYHPNELACQEIARQIVAQLQATEGS